MPSPDGRVRQIPERFSPWRSFRPWVLGGLAWAAISYLMLGEYLARTDGAHLREMCVFLSLLWWQFAFTGLFQAVRQGERWKLPGLALAAFLPPAGVCLLVSMS